MSVNDEITAIEAVVDELEKKIADGRLSVESLVSHKHKIMQGMTDAEMIANAEKIHDEIVEFSEIDRIDAKRIKELKQHHPNDSRINKLAHRAANCYFTLLDIRFSANIAEVTPDEKPGMYSDNQKLLNMHKETLPQLFGI
jgi:hypothetical protein